MLAGVPLVATPVVTRQPGHQLLGVAELHLGEELDGPTSAEDGRPPADMGDDDVLAPLLVGETNRSTAHRRSLALPRCSSLCTL